MCRFLHDDDLVVALRHKFDLGMHNLLDIGSSTEIYSVEDKIYRLSTDGSSQYLIKLGNRLALSVPRMYCNFGAVATIDASWDAYYWLCELERMSPLPESVKSDLEQWLEALLEPVEDALVFQKDFPLLDPFLHHCRDGDGTYARLAETLLQMKAVCSGELDLSVSNFMYRQATREIVVVDPAHGMGLRPEDLF